MTGTVVASAEVCVCLAVCVLVRTTEVGKRVDCVDRLVSL